MEAESVDDAISRIQSQVPEGYEILQTEVVSIAKADTITCSAATLDRAFGQARHKLPKGAATTDEKELRQPVSESISLEAVDEAAARLEVERRVETGTKIQSLKLEEPGSNGFWGIGKKPNRYRAQVFHPAVVQLSYRLTAKVSATLMSKEAAEPARAAVQKLLELHHAGSGNPGPTEQMRLIGYELESAGGVDLMLAAHTLLGRENPGAARLVERAWSGIGAWIS